MERNSFLYKSRRKLQIVAHKMFSNEFMSKLYFKIVLHQKLDLKNPSTFNEKLQWLKLYYLPQNPLVTKCADKYAVREYIKQKGYEDKLVPLLGVWDNANKIDWDNLPNKFILKCNHGCAYNIIVKNKDTENKKSVVKQLNKWLKEDFGAYNIELHYSNIKPRVITCERFLGENITDYKFFCFNGVPMFVYAANNLIHDRQAQIGFFYLDGSRMPLKRDDYEDIKTVKFPSFFNEMKKMAANLAKEFSFVRVDFFVTNNKYYFAELTFTPSACMMPFNPSKFDYELGSKLDISKEIKKFRNNK